MTNLDQARSQTRILICEDEEDLRDILEAYLQDVAGEVVAVENGQIAYDLLQRESFDVVLSDIKMPKLDGLSLLKKLREQEIDVPFILCTAFSDKDNAVAALRLGAFDFLEKPIDELKLRTAVDRALELSCEMKQMKQELDRSVDEYRKKQKAMLNMRLSLNFKKKAS